MELDDITSEIIRLAIEVHRKLGPGLFEKVYEAALFYELQKCGFKVLRQHPLPVYYDGHLLADIGYVIDLLVEGRVIIELKSVKELQDIHIAQTLTYMRLSSISCGLLINFNGATIKGNMRRLLL